MAWTKSGSTTITNTPSGSATYSDSFTSDNWVDQGAGVGVNTSTERLEFSSFTDNTTNNSSTLDLGSALSDTKWTIRFKLQWTGFSNTSDWTAPAIGMFSASSATAGNSAQDGLIYWGIANGATKASYISSMDNTTISGTDTNLSYAWVLDTTYYFQLVRDGTSFTTTIWTGSYEGTEVASGTNTIDGTNTGLRYFGVKSPVSNRGGSFTGWLDDLQIWNNQTTGASLDNVNVQSLSNNVFNWIIWYGSQDGQIELNYLYNNNSTGSNYARRKRTNFGSNGKDVSQNKHEIMGSANCSQFLIGWLCNKGTYPKLITSYGINTQGSSSSAPQALSNVGKWNNTATLNRIDATTPSANFKVSTNLTVLGSDGVESLGVQDGAIFYETDTNKEFLLYNNVWTEL